MKVLLIILGIIAFLAVCGVMQTIRSEKELLARVSASFGAKVTEEMNPERYASLRAYLSSLPERRTDIDEITWNDLDLDRVFLEMNHTCSAIGEEVLFALLHRPEMSEKELLRREAMSKLFMDSEEARTKAGRALLRMGKMRRISVYDYMMRLHSIPEEGNGKHYLALLSYLASVILMVVGQVTIGFGLFMLTALVNILLYLQRKGQIAPYLEVVSFITRWIRSVDKLTEELSGIRNEALEQELALFKLHTGELRDFVRGSGFLAPANPAAGDITELLMEYIRMLFHVDLIKFNGMLRVFNEKQDVLLLLFEETGRMDAARAIASYRTLKGSFSIPEFHAQTTHTLMVEEVYHPLVESPVLNSIKAARPVLLTGSNASGKSTFLKTIAINAILAQTIHTVLAKRYEGDFFHILSSMALRDDLAAKESYYIVEIRSLKRIMDASEEESSVLCFVDEVLRGTNTAERIAASSRILRYLSEKQALTFAATHDLELTGLLGDVYDNYHFSEQVKEDRVVFDYCLKEGKATSRNALKLLEMLEYPKEITVAANEAVEGFLTTGEWK